MPVSEVAGITYKFQDKLPKLPIPDLADTCASYLDVLAPLQTPREHQDTEEAVKEFLETTGPLLQEKLKAYAEGRSSYIEQFWYDSYLSYDSPVVLNLNPFFLLEDDSTPYQVNQVTRAAQVTMSSLRFVREYRREALAPDVHRTTPLCMYQYSRIFGSARIPTNSGCVMQSYNASKHIVVICRSQFYWFDVLNDDNDLILTEKEIGQNFQSIIEDAQATPINEAAKNAMGVLTTENRRIWANIRDNISTATDNTNQDCLKIIDWALFVVCLDHASPESLSDLTRNMLCGLSTIEKGVQVGTCTNRWYDKLQIIVTKNAKAGVNFEHTGVDGHTVLRFVGDVYTDVLLRFAKSINGNSPSIWTTHSPDPTQVDRSDLCLTPRKLEWKKSRELSLAMRFAETRLADLIHQNEFQVLEFGNFGASKIKEMGFSPDAFVQMGFQAAYYSLYGRVECTYEPAMTKAFLHGRTESIRTVSKDSLAFVRKFCEDAPASQKIDYLRQACKKHTATTSKCSKGLGQDRHLYALFCMWKRYLDEDSTSSEDGSEDPLAKMPGIFSDHGWDMLGNTILSTSNCGNASLRVFGFGPTSPDGYGLGYIIRNDTITICASSKHRQTQRFLDTLNACFLEFHSLWLQSTLGKVKTKNMSFEQLLVGKDTNGSNPTVHRASSRPLITASPHGYYYGRSLNSGTATPGEETSYAMGGYGYFDVGDFEYRSRPPSPEPHRRGQLKAEIGRKLRLAEY